MPLLTPTKHTQLTAWLDHFSREFLQTEKGRLHAALYESSRETARRNFDTITSEAAAGRNITDLVLDKLLPHASTPSNVSRGAWTHVAPTINGDIRDKFEGAGWAKSDDWPAIARMIFEFLSACCREPERLPELANQIDSNPLSKGMKAAFFSPMLNALEPTRFCIVNRKPLELLRWSLGDDFSSDMADYPSVNDTIRSLIEELTIELLAAAPALSPADSLDMFAHWLVVTKQFENQNTTKHGSCLPPGDTPVASDRIWIIGTGKNASAWPLFKSQSVVAIGWDGTHDLREYPDRNAIADDLRLLRSRDTEPTNDSLACWQFLHDLKVGDWVVAKSGRNALLGLGQVTGEYMFHANEEDPRHRRTVRWAKLGERTLDGKPLPMKALTMIQSPEFRSQVLSTFANDRVIHPVSIPPSGSSSIPSAYTEADALAELFMSAEKLTELRDQLKRKLNLVIQGPPGVGKTFVARRLAHILLGTKDDSRIEIVQFHPSMSYEDFVMGLRPDAKTGGFVLKPGVFHRFCEKARQDPLGRPHVFLIDEINRGNLAKIFGELLMLIESDKRGPDHAVTLAYESESAPRFSVPANIYLIGTMNTADRSLALVDYALRRRFAFVGLEPDFGERFQVHLSERDCEASFIQRLCNRLKSINEQITADTRSLGPGYQIGHSYFCGEGKIGDADAWLRDVVKFEIRPLLEEYWMDDPKRAHSEANKLLTP